MADYPHIDGMEPADFDYLRELRARVSESESFDDSAYVLQALDMILNPVCDDARLIHLSAGVYRKPCTVLAPGGYSVRNGILSCRGRIVDGEKYVNALLGRPLDSQAKLDVARMQFPDAAARQSFIEDKAVAYLDAHTGDDRWMEFPLQSVTRIEFLRELLLARRFSKDA